MTDEGGDCCFVVVGLWSVSAMMADLAGVLIKLAGVCVFGFRDVSCCG